MEVLLTIIAVCLLIIVAPYILAIFAIIAAVITSLIEDRRDR